MDPTDAVYLTTNWLFCYSSTFSMSLIPRSDSQTLSQGYPAVNTHNPPPTQWLAKLFPGSKAMGREVDQSRLPSADVKNEWSYTSISYMP